MLYKPQKPTILPKTKIRIFLLPKILARIICSILGMNLFGCKFCDKTDDDDDAQCDRKNFDTLLWALVTVFQVKMNNIY